MVSRGKRGTNEAIIDWITDPMSARMIEELEGENKKLIREKEIQKRRREELV